MPQIFPIKNLKMPQRFFPLKKKSIKITKIPLKNTVFLTNLDSLRHRTVPPPFPTVPHRIPPYPPFCTIFSLKKLKNGEIRWGTVR